MKNREKLNQIINQRDDLVKSLNIIKKKLETIKNKATYINDFNTMRQLVFYLIEIIEDYNELTYDNWQKTVKYAEDMVKTGGKEEKRDD